MTGSDGEKTGNFGLVDFGAQRRVDDPTAFEHEKSIDDVKSEAQDLLRNQDGKTALVTNPLEGAR